MKYCWGLCSCLHSGKIQGNKFVQNTRAGCYRAISLPAENQSIDSQLLEVWTQDCRDWTEIPLGGLSFEDFQWGCWGQLKELGLWHWLCWSTLDRTTFSWRFTRGSFYFVNHLASSLHSYINLWGTFQKSLKVNITSYCFKYYYNKVAVNESIEQIEMEEFYIPCVAIINLTNSSYLV